MEKQNVIHPNNGMLVSNKKEQIIDAATQVSLKIILRKAKHMQKTKQCWITIL